MSERDLKRIEVLSEVLAGSHVSARSIIRRYPLGEIPAQSDWRRLLLIGSPLGYGSNVAGSIEQQTGGDV